MTGAGSTHPLVAAAIREIEASHDFFVRWFLGTADEAEFALWLRTTHPAFRLTTPGGAMLGNAAIVAWIGAARGSMTTRFEIAVEDIEPIHVGEDAVLLIYVERQYRDGRITRRQSMAFFLKEDSAPRGVVWRHLQETWLQAPETEQPGSKPAT
ncbi:hypothetical protein GGR25_000534 [Kaistia hirudinis]|uniref:DUF4440 domain-containing protein n=1 Tax=Kaistia hirudinis TaxID=1293440 RepID=A0A840ALT8_9HYPH|nr:hypothetical protein [Kaistia hirudinis]MBB3929515.1 hypothetical protein [Kaistia hirudinis]